MKFTLVNKKDEASGTKSFFFKPETHIDYLAGQYFYITLPELKFPDSRGNTRHFTASSSPTEELIQITTRVRAESGYKQTLDSLPIGAIVEGKGPNGVFYFDQNSKGKHVFLAGGIGVTTFRSMTKYAIDRKLSVETQLIYSNSNADEVAFKEEVESWEKNYKNFKLNSIITSEVGRIDGDMLQKIVNDWNSTFWISGPPAFVTAMEEILPKFVKPEQIVSEKFTGY